ncbi:MAG TPA: EAL domain-containing protein [Acidimicrobiales bacterium]|nr:EAL domain-containing protein [Acidimicrobiales bacterium]
MSEVSPGQDPPRSTAPGSDLLAGLADQLPDALVVIDSQLRLRWANQQAQIVFGRSLADHLGFTCTELVHPDDLELALRSMGTIQGKDVGAPIELRVRTSRGWVLVELVGRPTLWQGDEAVALSIRDLTARRRFELAHDDDARFRSLIQHAAVITMLVSPGGVLASVSGALTRQLGHDPELVENRRLAEIVDPNDHRTLAVGIARASQGDSTSSSVTIEVGMRRHQSDDTVPYELTIVNLLDDPTVAGLVVTARDITDRKTAERGLHDALSLLTATLDSTADGILVVDREGKMTSYNGRFIEMWRLPPAVVSARDDAIAIEFVLEQLTRPKDFVAKIEELYAHPEAESRDTLDFKDGRVFERYSRPQRVDGVVVGRVWSFRDITERRDLEAELVRRALRDPLTGLANRPLFAECIEQGLARVRRDHRPLAVLFIDLDRFKQVNDSLGHSTGDQLLVEAAARIQSAVRESDRVARFGGDEFAVLCEDLDLETDAAEVADRVLKAFEEPFYCGERVFYVNTSIGIAASSSGTETAEILLQDADAAMYRAKDAGRGRYEAFDETMRYWVANRLELESALRQAIAQDQLRVHYQPIVDRCTLVVRGFEALVRWERPGYGLVKPGDFITVAEETGVLFAIGEWVLHEACREAAAWAARWPDHRLNVAVNVSSRQLLQSDIVEVVRSALTASGLAPERLTLELTETTLIDDALTAQRVIMTLRELGVRIALDDFGTGYSSLTYLRTFPIDMIKIDESFVRTIDTEPQTAAIVAAVSQLARDLGIEVVAEGIEKPSQLEAVVRLGCDGLQGFLFSEPRPADEVAELVEPIGALDRWAGTVPLGS